MELGIEARAKGRGGEGLEVEPGVWELLLKLHRGFLYPAKRGSP